MKKDMKELNMNEMEMVKKPVREFGRVIECMYYAVLYKALFSFHPLLQRYLSQTLHTAPYDMRRLQPLL